MMVLIFAFGIVFETPVVLVLLAVLDLVTAEGLANARSVVAVVILIVAAVLTPPDPISQISMAIPMYLMYEGAIIVIRLIKRPKKSEEKSIANV
jgi:sec-independent protein translocase protein TatC